MSSFRYVKGKLKTIKDKITERQFLLSNAFRVYLQDMARNASGNYKIKVELDQNTATDGQIIWINTIHPFHEKLPLAKKMLCIIGGLAHELFHILYTDFHTLKVLERKYGPNNSFRYSQAHECMNIVEDSAIERIGTNYYTGYFKDAIIYSNEVALDEMPSLDELAAKNAPRLSIFKQACAMYAIIGKVKGKLQDPELVEMFRKAIPILDKGRIANTCAERLVAAEELYDLMLPLIEEAEKNNQQNDQSFKYTKSSKISSGGPNAKPQPGSGDKDFTQKNRRKTKEELDESSGGQSDDKNESKGDSQKEEGSEQNQQGSGQSGETEEGKNDDLDAREPQGKANGGKNDEADKEEEREAADQSGQNNGKEPEDSKSEEGQSEGSDGDSDAGQSDDGEDGDDSKVGNDVDQGDEDDDFDLEKTLKELEKDINQIKDDYAKEEYDKEEQKRIEKEIQTFASQVSYSALHNGIRVVSVTSFQSYKIDAYNRLYEELRPTIQNTIHNIKRIIRLNEEERLNGLTSGKLNLKQLYRQDQRVFYKKREKSDEADLAILILIDESGSMWNSNRYFHARLASIMMYEVCKALQIPFAVIGHWATHRGVTVHHNHYVKFDSRHQQERLSLLNITPRENTREGVSLKYAGEYLLRRPETDKILIAISDGAPTHDSSIGYYGGEAARKDTARVAMELSRQGIKVFGLAIGEGENEIRKIYTKNFIDIEKIDQLPIRLVKLIERNLFVDR